MSPHLVRPTSGVYRVTALFLLLMGLRLGVALLIDRVVAVEKEVEVYYLIGQNLAQGNGFVAYPDGPIQLHRAPLYPFFLAGVYLVFGEINLMAVLFIQAAFDAGTAVLIWWIGRRLFGGTIGIAAAILFTLYPLSAYYTLRLLSEPLYTLALMAMMASLVRAMASGQPQQFLLAGALGGVAALVRQVALGFVPFLGILLLARARKQVAVAAPQVGYLLVGFALVLAPWTVRNYMLTGHVIPVATGGGYALWIGNNLTSDGQSAPEIEDTASLVAFDRKRREIVAQVYPEGDSRGYPSIGYPYIGVELDRAFARAALQEAQSHPLEVLTLMAKKFFRLWFGIFYVENRWAQFFVYLLQGSLLLLAGYGILRVREARLVIFPLLAVVVYTLLVTILFGGTLRYSIPLVPILMLFATIGAGDIGSRLASRLGVSLTPTGIRRHEW